MSERPTPDTDANAECEQEDNSPFAPVREWVYASFARRLERERDEARDALKRIEEYGTDEINSAVDLRQKLASALVERDEAREDLKVTQEAWVQVKTERIEALRERDEARDSAEKAKAYKRVLKDDNAKLRRELDELRHDTRDLLREIFNLTQIGDPHAADLPMRALQAIAEMIDGHLKEVRNGSER